MIKDNLILWFEEIKKQDISSVGGKAANLGEMFSKFPIPNGFCLTVSAFEIFLKENNNFEKIKDLVKNLDVGNLKSMEKISAKIKKIILKSKIPEELEEEIFKNYKKLSGFVAVRSSAVAEDLQEASFAGQQATFLNVRGENKLIKSIKECWASYYSTRAIIYRESNNFNHNPLMAVVVQEMVDSKKSGVIFTVNPVNKNKEEIMIESSFGLGEAIVSGIVTPDNFIVGKKNMEIISELINEKNVAIFKQNGKNKTIKLNSKKANERSLNQKEIADLSRIAVQIEEYYKKPMDIEFAIDDKIYILQARPVTTL